MNEQQQRVLAAGLKRLAETTRHASASAGVEAAVLARMQKGPARLARSSAHMTRSSWWFSAAAAAALVVASAAGGWLASRAESTATPQVIHPAGFIEIPGASVLPPIESGSIVRIALPVGALPQYGLAIPMDAIDGQVSADLLIAQDGVPRGIRLVHDDTTRSSTP